MGVIEETQHEDQEVISPVFLIQKPDGSYRMILNLKKFNQAVKYEHFKMEHLSSATHLITKGCKMASVDLKHAYYSVNVHPDYRRYLKFQWKDQLYTYTCLPNGLANCPRFFTKLMKYIESKMLSD